MPDQQEDTPVEDRTLPHGQTLLDWLGKRYALALDDAGLDPTVLPIPVIHDLATMPIDEGRLGHLLQLMAPLQRDLAARLAEANQPTQAPAPAMPAMPGLPPGGDLGVG